MVSSIKVSLAVDALILGGVIAYPTEAVWGLGCDPFNTVAIERLCQLKQRSLDKGLLLVAASVDQVEPWLAGLPAAVRQQVTASWPGPVTWLVPEAGVLPPELTGYRNSVALRVSDHPVVRELCSAFGGPIVSTSANRSGSPALKSMLAVQKQFGKQVDGIVPGRLGGLKNPSKIFDALTGQRLR